MGSKDYFDDVAGDWDGMRRIFFPDSLREEALDVAGVSSGQTAADIGAGTGFVSEALLERGLEVIAVDQSQKMLDHLAQKFAATGRLTCRPGTAEALPLDDGSVDYAFANMYLHHVEDPPEAIGEMARILRPGGVLVLSDLDEHEFEFLRTEHHDRWMGFCRADIQDWLDGAGLANVRVSAVGESCEADSQGCPDHASISVFLASAAKR